MSNVGEKIILWELLEKTTVEIPIIQRDYAQGRKGKEILRNSFIDYLFKALEDNSEEIILDFVYGSEEKSKLNPLDGQQRLTTLFLLHWYLAWKSGNLEKNKERLKNFTYETRVSSRDFIKELCNRKIELNENVIQNSSETNENENKEELSLEIKNQSWFFSEWLQDPTISSMLRTLDDIHLKFQKEEKIENLWQNLTENNKISFYYLKLENFGLTDDLYIKMNARGKPLTPFENFKADLVGYIRELAKENATDEDKNELISNIDNAWTDVFWKNKNIAGDGEIDEIYFAFINRFFSNEFICLRDSEKSFLYTNKKLELGLTITEKFDFTDDKYSILDKSLQALSQKELDYFDFSYYSLNKENCTFKDMLLRLNKILLNLKKIEDYSIFKFLWQDDFEFIPIYINSKEKKEISSITQSQRVLFYAITKFLEYNKYNNKDFTKKLERWIRVVSNIVENADIGTVDSMVSHMKLIDELSKFSNDIYRYLGRVNKDFNQSKNQMREECEKAKKIIEDSRWEEKIIEAENTAFFKGAIRFLFTKENKEINWTLFDEKLENSKKYFCKEGIKKEYAVDFIIAFVSRFTEWSQIHKTQILDVSGANYKKIIFSEDRIYSFIQVLETKNLTKSDELKFGVRNIFIDEFLNENLIKFLYENHNKTRFYGWNSIDLYPPYAAGNIRLRLGWVNEDFAINRNDLLRISGIEVENEVIDASLKFQVWNGWDIYFNYNGTRYLWGNEYDKVYKVDSCNEILDTINLGDMQKINKENFILKLNNENKSLIT